MIWKGNHSTAGGGGQLSAWPCVPTLHQAIAAAAGSAAEVTFAQGCQQRCSGTETGDEDIYTKTSEYAPNVCNSEDRAGIGPTLGSGNWQRVRRPFCFCFEGESDLVCDQPEAICFCFEGESDLAHLAPETHSLPPYNAAGAQARPLLRRATRTSWCLGWASTRRSPARARPARTLFA